MPEKNAQEEPSRAPQSKDEDRETPRAGSAQKLVCKKTGKTMAWDEAYCPNEGKPCGYRADCIIQAILAERKDEESETP